METLIKRIVCILCMLQICLSSSTAAKLNVLVFGGNGFIGAETVELLLDNGHKVTMINRGNWYWDTATRIKPRVVNYICDRTQSLRQCSSLNSMFDDVSLYFDFLIDFSAYYPSQVADSIDILKNKVGKYIYISSDSVYEVCQKNHDGYSVETDAVRPANVTKKDELNKKDEYGDGKLGCEETLQNSGISYLILRLPDVIGPRDTTFRWWTYQLWIKLSAHLTHQITIPKRLFYKPLSFVYVSDVAKIILRSLSFKAELFNEAYNLAFSETKTLYQLLDVIRNKLDKSNINVMLDERPDYMYMYPSVDLGPISIEKAKTHLDWNPMPFEVAVEKTTMFYEDAIFNEKFSVEARKVIKQIQTYFTENPDEVYKALENEYGIRSKNVHDEL